MGAVNGEQQAVEKDLQVEEVKPVTYSQLFRFAKWWEILLVWVAIGITTIGAANWPLLLIVYGEFAAVLVERAATRGDVTPMPFLQALGGGQVM